MKFEDRNEEFAFYLLLIAIIGFVLIISLLPAKRASTVALPQGEQMENQEELGTGGEKVDVGALLKSASAVPGGVQLADWDPMENIATIAVGREFEPGMTIVGTYVETETLTSKKFTNAKRFSPDGIPQQDRHILRLANGQLLGIWTTGELTMIFSKLAAGEVVSLTYTGKGKNASDRQQHFFSYKRQKSH